MLNRSLHLVDPVERTRDMETREFTKYIDIAQEQVRPTDQKVVKEIENRFFASHPKSEKNDEYIKKVWDFVASKIKVNAGLAAFILDYKGAESNYFFPWLYNVFRSPSLALEMAYGAGYNLDGEWIENIPEDDPIDMFVRNDPTFVYNRERQLFVANLVTMIQNQAWRSDRLTKVVDLGAGRLAWARWHGFKFDETCQEVLAFDKDPSINMEEILGYDPRMVGLTFKHGDLMVQINNPDCMNADLVILGGVASYIREDVFREAVIMPIYHLLNQEGIFFYDLQIDCPYLRRSMCIFDWPKMYLANDLSEAISNIENTRKLLWQKGLKFSAEYAVDTYNEYPTAIMVMLQKI